MTEMTALELISDIRGFKNRQRASSRARSRLAGEASLWSGMLDIGVVLCVDFLKLNFIFER